MALYGYEPPDLELANIDEQRTKENQYKAVKSQIESKPDIGVNLEGIVNKYGNVLGRDIMVGSALLGFTEDSPEISALVKRQIEIEQEKSKKFGEQIRAMGRGLVRGAFVGLDSFAEALIKRPYQAAARAAIDGGMSPQWANLIWISELITAGNGENVIEFLSGDKEFAERYDRAKAQLGPTVATRALKSLAKGEKVNLGEGYFGNSTLARDTAIYKQIAGTIKDPSQLQAVEQVIQQQLGTPITELEREAVEANKYRGQTISPGRIMAMNFAQPGTERYRQVSGLIDGVVTLGLDPANLVGAWVGKLSKAGKAFTTTEKMTGWLATRATGADIYQGVDLIIDGKRAFRYVDVGDNILTKPTYTLDELDALAKEGGRNTYRFFTQKGQTVTSKNKVKPLKGKPFTSLGKTISRVQGDDVNLTVLIDRDAIKKTLRTGPDGQVIYGGGRAGIKEGAIKDYEEYVDFILDHEATHALAFKGEAPAHIQRLHDKSHKLRRARPEDMDVDAVRKAQAEYETAINAYVSGLRIGRVKNVEKAKNASGLSKVLRPSLNKTRFEEWHNTTGKQIYEFIYDNVQSGGIKYEDLMKILPDLDPASKQAILKANSADTVGDIIAKNVRSGNITKRLDPYSFTFRGHVSRAAGRVFGKNGKILDDGGKIDFSDMGDFLGVGAVVSRKASDSKMFRLFKEVSPSYITAHSTVKGFRELEKLVDSLPFNANQRKELFEKLGDANVKLNDMALSGTKVSKVRMTEEFYNVLLGSGVGKDKGILGELQKLMTAKGFPKEFSGGIQNFIAEIRESRKYWVSIVGDEVVDVGFSGSKSGKAGQQIKDATKAQLDINEIENLAAKGDKDAIKEFILNTYDGDLEFAQPTAQLMSEMLTGNIPLPDMNETFRILGTFRNTLYEMTGLNKLGPKRIDLPQLLSSKNYGDELSELAKTDKTFAEFISKWSYPTLDNTTVPSSVKNPRKYIEQKQLDARKELLDEFEKITGRKFEGQFEPIVLEVFDMLDDPTMLQEAFGAGNIASNAVTKNIAKLFYKYDKEGQRLTNSVLFRLANNAVTQVWKPFQLLRFAWTVRVISEEQLRMFAADLSNMWTHPISHLAYAFNRKASTDILGKSFQESLLFKQGMSRGSNGILIRKANSVDRFFDVVQKDKALRDSASRRRYAQGWATELQQLADDDLVVEVARIISGKGKYKFSTLDELADALVYRGGFTGTDEVISDDLWKQYQAWAEESDAITLNSRREIVKSQDRTLEFLESLQARLVEKTGGDFKKYIKVKGQKVEIPKGTVYRNAKDENGLPLRMYYEITENGKLSDPLIEGIAKGETQFGYLDAEGKYVETLKLPLGRKASEKQYDELLNELERYVEIGPEVVKVSRRIDNRPGVGASYNNAVNAWFDILMSKPTNFLSRSPAFKQFYWQRIADTAYTLNAEALEAVRKNARAARADKKIIKKLDDTIPTQGGVNFSNIDQYDEIAKAVALQDVQELLYDLNRRSQFSQATALIFPFAEVHKEIATTWTRLLRENPTKLRKMYLTVDSARESDPNNDNDSFLYTDPLTNEEVFVIPVVDKVLNNYFQTGQFFGGENITDESTRMRTVGFASSANIVAGGLIPGVGPAVQIGAKYLMPNMKENSAIYKTLFPYGINENDIDYLIPSWLRKGAAALQVGPESWQTQYTNTAKDLMKAKIVAGHLDLSSEEKVKQSLQLVKRQATVLTLIRSGVQGSFLTGGSFRWEKEVMPGGELYMNPEELVNSGLDPDGRYFAFNVWATVYYQLLRENGGDSLLATQQFNKLYGYDPTALLISKSKEIRRTPYTEPGLAAADEQLFQDLPDVAYYFNPDSPLDEFSYTAWVQSFTADAIGEGIARYDLEINEWAALYNMAAGRLAMENFRRNISTPGSVDYVASAKVRNEMLFRMNGVLRETFPGYDIQPRTPGPTDLDTQIRQLREGAMREDMKDNPVAKALNIYFQSYDNFEEILQKQAGSLQVSPKRLTGYYVRETFRKHAEELYTKYPEFYYVWQDILSKQIEENLVKLLEEGANL